MTAGSTMVLSLWRCVPVRRGEPLSVWETRLGVGWRQAANARRLLPWKSEIDLAVGPYYTDLRPRWQDPICRLLKLLSGRFRHKMAPVYCNLDRLRSMADLADDPIADEIFRHLVTS